MNRSVLKGNHLTAPVWCRSAHIRFIDPTINDAMGIGTGCLRPTPADMLPTLADIQLAELRRNGATLSPARRAMETEYLLHAVLTCPPSANARHLKSRHPFPPAAQKLIISSDKNSIRAVHRADHQWNAEWLDNPTRLRTFIPDTGTYSPATSLPKQRGSGINASARVSGVSAPTWTNGIWSPPQPVSGTQKNKPSTTLFSNVQPIDLPMDCTA